MKKELFIHFAFWFSFFVFVSIFRNYLALSYWPFWLGGFFGTLLPNIDHLIYVFFLNPHELTSQRISFLVQKKEISRVLTLLSETRTERKNLIFHTFLFQILFLIISFLIVTSSTSIFAKGLVLAFLIHLIVDQLVDIIEIKNLDNWGNIFPVSLDRKKSILYIFLLFLIVCIMSFLM